MFKKCCPNLPSKPGAKSSLTGFNKDLKNGLPVNSASVNGDMSSKPVKVLMLLGSTRDGRVGERVAALVRKALENSGQHNVDIFDPLQLDLPMLRQPLHFYPDWSKAPKQLLELNQRIVDADAYVVVTPEYNRMLPPALLNMIDHFPPPSYSGKASAIVTYSMGVYGGQMVNAPARILLDELGAPPVPFMLSIGQAQEKIDPHGATKDPHVESGLKKMIAQLDWWAAAGRNQRQSAGPMPSTF